MGFRYTVKQGDSVSRLCAEHGFFPETIWDHAENAALKTLRKDMNILAPGDELYIPDREEGVYACETGKRHVFRRRAVPMLFKVQLLDGNRPRANLAYVLDVDGLPFEGNTDADGQIAQYIPNGARRGRLVVDGGALDVALDFGYMDPADSPSGVRKRLLNLGYACENETADALHAALRAFQADVGLAVSGELDDATRDELARCHDEAGVYRAALERAEHAKEPS